MNRKYLSHYFLAFILATIIFSLVFLVSYAVSFANYKSVGKDTNLIRDYVKDLDLYLNQSLCESELLYDASDKLDFVGNKLNILETRLGKNDKRVLEQKKLYSELEVKHFQIVEKINEECEGKFITLLFFYSNSENSRDASEKSGFILDTFKRGNVENVMTYSFDFDLEAGVINFLKAKYGVEDAPIVIVKGTDLVRVDDIGDLEKYILGQ